MEQSAQPIDITYYDKVGKMLHDLNRGDVFALDKNVAPTNREKFITSVKWFIDSRIGNAEGWEILFTPDYSKIVKLNIEINGTK